MSAGQIHRQRSGIMVAEIQAATIDRSGWALVVPLQLPTEAHVAAPLVVHVDSWRARAHLLTSMPTDLLGPVVGQLDPDALETVRAAVTAMLDEG